MTDEIVEIKKSSYQLGPEVVEFVNCSPESCKLDREIITSIDYSDCAIASFRVFKDYSGWMDEIFEDTHLEIEISSREQKFLIDLTYRNSGRFHLNGYDSSLELKNLADFIDSCISVTIEHHSVDCEEYQGGSTRITLNKSDEIWESEASFIRIRSVSED